MTAQKVMWTQLTKCVLLTNAAKNAHWWLMIVFYSMLKTGAINVSYT
jgi:hypothetical protein